jgi:hypothetical protein
MEKIYTSRKKFISVTLILFALISLTMIGKVQSQIIVTVMNIDSVQCYGENNGSIDISVSGGTPGYTYLWNTTPTPQTTQDAINLSAGTYTVTVTDAIGNSATQSATVYEPTEFNVVLTNSTDVLCHGLCNGTATVTASGGTPPYSYYWSDGQTISTLTGLCAENYFVTVSDANGCSADLNFNISEPAQALQSSIGVTNVACYGQATGAINLTVWGGTPNYTYHWAPGNSTLQDLTGVPAGTYFVTITDANGCTLTDTAIITQPATAVCVTVTSQDLVCWGVCEGLVVATPCGGTPGMGGYTFSWDTLGCVNDSLIDICAGTFTVTVTDGAGCTASGSAIVDQPPQPAILNFYVLDVLCYGECTGDISLYYADIQPTNTYLWSDGATTQDNIFLCAGLYCVTVTTIEGCIRVGCVTVDQPAQPLQSSMVITNVACYGQATGAINLTVTGGTPPYTYNWLPGGTVEDLTGILAGAYFVTITDANGCTLVDTAIVSQPATPVCVTVTSQDLVCWGVCEGLAVATPCGGTPTGGFTFIWDTLGVVNDSLIDVCAGTYTVTITDGNGCTASASTIIDQPPQPAPLNFYVVDVLCYGDSTGDISLYYADIQPTDTYLWSNGVTTQDNHNMLCAGLYCVTVTTIDGCIRIACITVTQPPAIAITLLPINENCPNNCDGSIQSIVTGGTPGFNGYTYFWSTGQTTQDITNLCVGTYSLTVTDSLGCTAEEMEAISTSWQVISDATANPVSGFYPLTVNFTFTGSGAFEYLWDFGDGTAVSADQNPIHVFDTAGTFDVLLVASSEAPYYCMDTSHLSISVWDPFLIEENVGINNLITLFPNPVTNNLQIQTPLKIDNIEITDIAGRLLYTTTSKTIDCSGFTRGVYFVKVGTFEGIAVKKFIKE